MKLVSEVTISINSKCPAVFIHKPAQRLAQLILSLPEKFNSAKVSVMLSDVRRVDNSLYFDLVEFFKLIAKKKDSMIFKEFRMYGLAEG